MIRDDGEEWKWEQFKDLPAPMLRDMKAAMSPEDALELAEIWRNACPLGRADIEAFHEPMEGTEVTAAEHVRQLGVKDRDGTPTSVELEEGLGQ